MIAILNQMKIFDQQIVPPGSIAQQLSDLFEGGEIELPSFWKSARTLPRTVISLRALPIIMGAVLLHAPISFSTIAQRPLRV